VRWLGSAADTVRQRRARRAGRVWLEPKSDAAKIRAFFVDPEHARHGIGRAILARSEAEATRAGFSSFELMATLPGVRLYEKYGYVPGPAIDHPLPGGLTIRVVPMHKP
jgi:GNAT superfamily N-acetyltransferase